VLEGNGQYVNLSPKGEPLLGKRGLYGAVGGMSPAQREQALLWVLNQSDGTRPLLEVARRSGMEFQVIREAATALEGAGLLRPAHARAAPRRRRPAARHKSTSGAARAKRKASVKRGRRQ